MFFNNNRERFFKLMENRSIAIIPSGIQKKRCNDSTIPFRQDSNFYYLTGFLEDHAILVMYKSEDKQKSILFVHSKDPEKELWNGERLGEKRAKEYSLVDETFSIDDFYTKLPNLLKNKTLLYKQKSTLYDKIDEILINLQEIPEKHLYPNKTIGINEVLFKLRRFKQPYELENIKKALDITAKAHYAAMAFTKPLRNEYEVMALIEYIFKTNGAAFDAYTSIVAGGNNANTLHYALNSHRLVDGDLVLIDAGSEFNFYASDITRCFPVNGKFSTQQKELYEIVLKTQKKVISKTKPKAYRSKLNDIAIKMLSEGLKQIGIFDQSIDEIIQKKLYKPYYPHNIGHCMGLDVHEPMAYKDSNDKEFALEVDDVLTIEPGLYLRANDQTVPKAFRGIGIRIEDNILLTNDGNENLSHNIVKEIDDIENKCQVDIFDFYKEI